MYIDQKTPPTLSKDQATVHNQIFKFYNDLFSYKLCNESFPDLQEFTKDIHFDKVTEAEIEG